MSSAPFQMDIGSMHVGKALHGRILIVALLVAYFSLVGWRAYSRGWVAGWQIFHVRSVEPPFRDLRVLLQGLDRYRAGTPIREIQNYWSMPYPSPWIWLLAPTGLGDSQAILFGVILAFIVTAVTIVFLGSQTLPEALFTAVLLMSPSFMLGIERGNVDLILFLIVLPAIWLLSKRFAAAAASVVFFAAILKLYPIAALLCFLRKQRVVLMIGVAALFAVCCLLSLDELRRIANNAPRSTYLSFGCMVPFVALYHALIQHGAAPSKVLFEFAGLMAALVLAAVTVAVTWSRTEIRLFPGMPGLAFLAGAGIYLLCFLIGNNFAYRLRWLILILPQTFFWVRHRRPGWRRSLAALTAALLSAVATNASTYSLRYVAELVNWLLFTLLVSLSANALKYDIKCAFDGSASFVKGRLGFNAAPERRVSRSRNQ